MAEKRQYVLDLYLHETGGKVRVEDPSILNHEIVIGAAHLLSDYLEDALEDVGIEGPTDERYREAFIELLYKLIYHEMCTLHLLPGWEKIFKQDVGTRRRGPRPDAYVQWLKGEENTDE